MDEMDQLILMISTMTWHSYDRSSSDQERANPLPNSDDLRLANAYKRIGM